MSVSELPPQLVSHNLASLVRSADGVVVDSDARCWSFAVSMPVDAVPAPTPTPGSSALLRVDLVVEAGQVGVGLMDDLLEGFVTPELVAAPGSGIQTLEFPVDADNSVVMFRNVSEGGIPSRFRIVAAEIVPRGDDVAYGQQLWGQPNGAVQFGECDLPAAPVGGGPGVAIISPAGIRAFLGEAVEIRDDPADLLRDPLLWRMDPDDARILRAIYAATCPRRHLELGTWEGFGVVLCAQAAPGVAITTVNLPDGEASEGGPPRYSVDGVSATDSGLRIGWRYRAAGLGDRVQQVLADTTTWNPDLPDAYFDSVLIDGGHASPVVASDTELALRLTRPGGLIMWHDFCPVPRVMQQSEAARGVVTAIATGLVRWAPMLEGLAWVRPSFLLIGRRSAHPWGLGLPRPIADRPPRTSSPS